MQSYDGPPAILSADLWASYLAYVEEAWADAAFQREWPVSCTNTRRTPLHCPLRPSIVPVGGK